MPGAECLSPEGVEILAGNRVPVGAEPIALAYAATGTPSCSARW